MRQGADNPQLGEKGDAARTLELGGRTRQMGADPRQRDLRGIGLENHQVALQLFEGQAALFVETSGEGTVFGRKKKIKLGYKTVMVWVRLCYLHIRLYPKTTRPVISFTLAACLYVNADILKALLLSSTEQIK